MKRHLFIIVAALGLAGCAEKMPDSGSPSQKGELERSYISVTLKSDDAATRADGDPDFEYGKADERYVDNVHFFLFKDDGSAFPVNGVGGKNYLSFDVNSGGTQPGETGKPNEGPNVSDVKDKILVFDNYKGEYPTHIVAVLNWDTDNLQPSYSLNNLYNTLTGIRNTAGHFVMSNSVYADMQGKIVRANALTIDNIGKVILREDFNAKHIVSIVGTRHASEYGKGVCENFVTDLAKLLPGTLIVSGLAYGIDICAHRAALKAGLPTTGILAHGLDRIYPNAHRSTAKSMLENGGLATEFMSGTNSLPPYFVQRNRIVAGLADATVVIESASKGGSLITASLAQSYSRDCFAFPGRVNDQYSQGCNELVSRNKAALITSAYDLVEAMGWETTARKSAGELQTELFPELAEQENEIITALRASGDGLQINQMVVMLNTPINKLMPLLFEMEMKGYIKAVAGGCYRSLIM